MFRILLIMNIKKPPPERRPMWIMMSMNQFNEGFFDPLPDAVQAPILSSYIMDSSV